MDIYFLRGLNNDFESFKQKVKSFKLLFVACYFKLILFLLKGLYNNLCNFS
jgi:hypothetical protein